MATSLAWLRTTVIQRDRQCVAALLDRSHQCRNRWGDPHGPADADQLTLEHVHYSGRRIDHPLHCIALCHNANVVDHWSSANNALANAYLAGIAIAGGER